MLCAWCFLCSPAIAQKTVLDGNSLQNQCVYYRRTTNGDTVSMQDFGKGMFCVGYIRGVLDGLFVDDVVRSTNTSKSSDAWENACIPKTVSNDQAIKVVLKYLDDNPAKLDVPASMLVVKALAEAFPCK